MQAIFTFFPEPYQLILSYLLLTLGISALGFHRVVYFISIGYAFSITGMAGLTAALYYDQLSWISTAQLGLLIIWGLRLGIFLTLRELRASYQRELQDVHHRSAGISLAQKFLIWIGVSILYMLMFSPALVRVLSNAHQTWISHLVSTSGLVLTAGGLLLEIAADRQKSNFKARNPDQFTHTGLYRWVRCPNYLGEIAFWVGSWLTAIPAYQTPFHWLTGTTGLICIILIMMGSTKRLEQKHLQRYGDQTQFQEYIQQVPVLFPWVPVYSLEKVPVILE